MTKRVQLSSDGITFYTLPGNTGEISSEMGMLDDTIFGQNFTSEQPNLMDWKVNSNGLFKGLAGYQVSLKKTGTPTTMTAEAMTLVSGKTYQITAPTKRIIDPLTAVSVFGNAVAITNDKIESIDYLTGKVTFISSYTPTTPITLTGKYLPTSVVGGAKTFSLSMTAETKDETTIPEAQANSGCRIFAPGLKKASLELTGVYAISNGFLAALQARAPLVVEINPDGSQQTVARGFFMHTKQAQSGDNGSLEEEQIAFSLHVPDVEKMLTPFSWTFTSSTLSQALRKAIAAWETDTLLHVRYLPDGTVGVGGEGVVTDISLSGGLEAMNEFTVNVQGSGALSAV